MQKYSLSTLQSTLNDFVLKTKLLPTVLLTLSQAATAQQFPSAGNQIQQIQQTPSVTTPGTTFAPELKVQPGALPGIQANISVTVETPTLRIIGATQYTEAELIAVAGFKPGSKLTLGQLRAMAQRIESYLQGQGYFLARAYLPSQGITGESVTVAVAEGRYGERVLRNSTNLSDSVVNGLLDGINSGDVVFNAALERRLLLMSELPGVLVKSTLVPGTARGTSDLIVDVTPGKRVNGSVDFDNQGNIFTGKNRIGGTLYINNPLGQGDVLSLRALTSTQGLDYGRAGYQAQIGQAKVGAAYTSLAYRLNFQGQDLKGAATIASLYGSYPLIRSRNNNLYAQIGYDSKRFHDPVTLDGVKQAHVWLVNLNGDFRDSWGGGGLSSYSLSATAGSIDLQTPGVQAFDALTSQRNGNYSKVGMSALRLQRVTDGLYATASLRGQLASKNLDSSEKFTLGGTSGVRAYPEGEAPGDQGYVISLEGRVALPHLVALMPGRVQLLGFYDNGLISLSKTPWTAAHNRRNLSGAGLGLNWTVDNVFMVKTYYARKLGSEPATSAPDSAYRFGLQFVKYY